VGILPQQFQDSIQVSFLHAITFDMERLRALHAQGAVGLFPRPGSTTLWFEKEYQLSTTERNALVYFESNFDFARLCARCSR
jgi:hypothetical protein